LRQTIHSNGLTERVVVRHFHGWCGDMLTAYNVEKPKQGIGPERYAAEQVSRTIAAVDIGQIPRAQYGAVMIDEGHDFEPDWFKLVVQMVDPEKNSMLVLYDDAQAIYGSKETSNKRRKFSFASVGVQAKGRTTILRLNYRNTLEILSVARMFASELLSGEAADEDGVPIISPESAGRSGAVPEVLSADSAAEGEARLVSARILDEMNQGRTPNEIGILYRKEAWAKSLEGHLTKLGIPVRAAIGSGKDSLFDGAPSVKLVSMHSSKGLEFAACTFPESTKCHPLGRMRLAKRGSYTLR
jgi:superfamily I DNA/RNA helicase